MSQAKLYSSKERTESFRSKFLIALLQAGWHSCCIVLIPYYFIQSTNLNSLTFFDFKEFYSSIIYSCLIVIINLKILLLDAASIGMINLIGLLVTLFVWIIYLFSYGCLNDDYSIACNVLFQPECIFIMLLVISTSLLFDFVIKAFKISSFSQIKTNLL